MRERPQIMSFSVFSGPRMSKTTDTKVREKRGTPAVNFTNIFRVCFSYERLFSITFKPKCDKKKDVHKKNVPKKRR